MVQAANLGKHDDPTGFRPLDWPRLRRILEQPKVSSALVDIDYVEGMLTLSRQASATIGRQARGRQSGLAAAVTKSAARS